MGKWLKSFFEFSFLPPAEVSEAFCILIELSPSENALKLADYILENYKEENSLFPSEMWAEAPSSIPKTTNGPESFHEHLQSAIVFILFYFIFYSVYPYIWKVRPNYKYQLT